MAEQSDELSKLITIATDMDLSAELRNNATKQMGKIGSQEALRALLDLAANEKLSRVERELAIKNARDIIRSNR